MTTKLKVSLTDDGLVHYDAGDGHVVITGQATGRVTLPDGSTVDVTPPVVLAESPEHALAIADAIGRRFAENGHPAHTDDVPFVHTPSAISHGKGFAEAVRSLQVPEGQSRAQAVLDHLTTKKG